MNYRDIDTSDSWKMLMWIINLIIVFCVLGFAYLLLENQIHEYLNKPNFSPEEMSKRAEQREIEKRRAREDNWDLVENGIHVKTGLAADENLQLIIGSCTSCHSAKLITQNRATRQGWKNMIVWMQETQGLPDLGSREPRILNYLSKHYAPQEVGRRQNLDEVEWYILNLEESAGE